MHHIRLNDRGAPVKGQHAPGFQVNPEALDGFALHGNAFFVHAAVAADDLLTADIPIRAGDEHPLQPPLRRHGQKKPQHLGAVALPLLACPDGVADVSAPDGEHRVVNVVAQVDDAHHLPVPFPLGKIHMGGNLAAAVFRFLA